MMGWQCSKRLWLHKRRPDLIPEITGNKLALFERGNNIGLLGRGLFPGGKDATPANPALYVDSIRKTYEWINYGESIIYDASFQYNDSDGCNGHIT